MKHITDGGGISLGNDEHPNSMAARTAAYKRGGAAGKGYYRSYKWSGAA
jgi:hypothetical protein